MGRHRQLPPRVIPTLVTPLHVGTCFSAIDRSRNDLQCVCRVSIKLYTHSLTHSLLVQFSQCRDLLNVSTNQSFLYADLSPIPVLCDFHKTKVANMSVFHASMSKRSPQMTNHILESVHLRNMLIMIFYTTRLHSVDANEVTTVTFL